jgi:hypothetical protein
VTRLLLGVLGFVAWVGSSCGTGSLDACNGIPIGDGQCRQPIHWTAARATKAADGFTFARMVRGRLSKAECRIVARHPGYDATADCRALFTAPHT